MVDDLRAHLFVCDEVCLLEQLLFVMLEFSDHVDDGSRGEIYK